MTSWDTVTNYSPNSLGYIEFVPCPHSPRRGIRSCGRRPEAIQLAHNDVDQILIC
jgi:hypothetical protein